MIQKGSDICSLNKKQDKISNYYMRGTKKRRCIKKRDTNMMQRKRTNMRRRTKMRSKTRKMKGGWNPYDGTKYQILFDDEFEYWYNNLYTGPKQEINNSNNKSLSQRFRRLFKKSEQTPEQIPTKTRQELIEEFLESETGKKLIKQIEELEIKKNHLNLPEYKVITEEENSLTQFQEDENEEKTKFMNKANEEAKNYLLNIKLKDEPSYKTLSQNSKIYDVDEIKRFANLYKQYRNTKTFEEICTLFKRAKLTNKQILEQKICSVMHDIIENKVKEIYNSEIKRRENSIKTKTEMMENMFNENNPNMINRNNFEGGKKRRRKTRKTK